MHETLADASGDIVVLLGRSFPASPPVARCIGDEAFSRNSRLGSVRRALFENISAPFDLLVAASLAHLSAQYFSRFFHLNIGMPFWQWVDICRIMLAASLIGHNSVKLYLVGPAVGFKHVDTLRRVFKREFGVTPSRFAALCRTQPEESEIL